MIVHKTAAKKTLAMTLALALGLTLPGGAWAQVFTARAVPAAASSAAGAAAASASASASAAAGVQTMTLKIPSLNIGGAALDAPTAALGRAEAARAGMAAPATLSMPAPGAYAAPAAVESHPVIALINQLQKAGVPLPETFSSHADAAKLETAAQALPEGSPARGRLAQLAAAIRANAATGSYSALGAAFDGGRGAAPASFTTQAGENSAGGPSGLAPAPNAANYELTADQVRYTPAASALPESTKSMPASEQQVVGQDEALKAIRFGLEMKPAHYNLFIAGADGSGREMAARRILAEVAPQMKTPGDVVAATNFDDPDKPVILEFAPGKGAAFADGVENFVEGVKELLPQELMAGETGQKKQQMMAKVQAEAAKRQKDFDAKIGSIKLAGKFGVYFSAQQGKDGNVRIAYGPSFNGKTMTDEEVKAHVAAGDFTQAELDQAKTELNEKKGGVLEAFQAKLSDDMQQMQALQAAASKLDEKAAVKIVNRLATELLQTATSGPETAAEKAVNKRAEERDAELNDELQKLGRQKFGQFGVTIQAGIGQDGKPVLIALPVFERQAVTDEASAALIAAGKFTAQEYAQAKAQIARKATAIYEKMAEYVAQTERERAQLAASRPAPTAETAKIKAYVQSLAQAAVDKYPIFLGIKEGGEGVKPVPGSRPLDPQDFFRVSVLSDNAATKGAPVVWEENPTYERLFGVAEGNQRNMIMPGVGMVKTEGVGGPSFKAGSYMKANGGFLVMRAMDVLRNPGSWQALMQAVRTGQAEIAEGGFMGMASKMEEKLYHVPAKVKIVLIGSPMIQMLLSEHDEDFAANFQGIAQFQSKIEIAEDAVAGFLNFLKHSVAGSAGEIMDLSRGAIARVLQHAARLADSNQYFTAQFGALHGLLQEATYWAQKAGRTEVAEADVETALKAKRDREEAYIMRMMNAYTKGVFRVETSGEAVGQINGLAVMGSIGVPARVTFVAGPGQPGIVSTDKDAGSTGKSFNKALGNEWNFLRFLFGQEKMPKVQVSVSFEQNYGGIDGDSATSTTIYGILSALSGIPIRQKFAVTGSADQFGNVQAIGGANEKIEGFFLLCKSRGLTGDQGVIIPKTNVADLQLSPEVAQAIAEGKFHIYAVENVQQGLEILTGRPFEEIKAKAAARVEEFNKSFEPKKDAPAAPAGDSQAH